MKKNQLLLSLKYNFQVCTFSPAVEKCANFKFGPQALCRKSLQARTKNYNRYVRCHEHDLLKKVKKCPIGSVLNLQKQSRAKERQVNFV